MNVDTDENLGSPQLPFVHTPYSNGLEKVAVGRTPGSVAETDTGKLETSRVKVTWNRCSNTEEYADEQ